MIGDLIKMPDPEPGDEDDRKRRKVAPVALYRRPWFRRKWFYWLLLVLLLCFVGAIIGSYIFARPYYEKAQGFDLAEIGELEKASVIYDTRGRELGRLYVQNRRPVPLDDIPFHLVQAFTATEDKRFFNHEGVDFIGIARAVLRNLMKPGARSHGASTITMQLARDAFELRGGLTRKLTEAFIAYRIEKDFTKAEILELYLNRIYFGEGYYGVLAASQGYFGKSVSDLTVGEAAILAGMPKSPNAYSPRRHPEDSKSRRDYVLSRMAIEDSLSSTERDRWQETPIKTAPKKVDVSQSSYVYEQIRQRIVENIGNQRALSGGFHIYSTIDIDLQAAAEKAVIERLRTAEESRGYAHQTYDGYRTTIGDYEAKLAAEEIHPDTKRPPPLYLQAAALVIDNHTGAVRALVGGRDFHDSKYDRALLSRRAVGTAFKPIVYASAFEGGSLFPGSLLKDTPIDNRRVMIGGLTGILGEWGLEASNQDYSGKQITAREALVNSRNAATVRLGEMVGLERVTDTAERMGIASPIKEYPASYLGSSEASLAEMTLAYTAFPLAGERPASMFFIRKIVDDEGRTIFQREGPELSTIPVLDPVAAYQVHSCLLQVPETGTASNASELGLLPMPVGGKTGTHYNFKDLWFIGYSSQVTCGVWVGFDKPKTIYNGAFSNKLALPIWVDIMNATADRYVPTALPRPKGLQTIEICTRSGRVATDACYEHEHDEDNRVISIRTTYPEVVGADVRINEFCDVHSGEPLASQILAAALTPKGDESSASMGGRPRQGSGIQMRAPTVLGSDPYQSIRPVLKAIAVNPDEDNGAKGAPAIRRATAAQPLFLGNPKYRIELTQPKAIEIVD